MDEPEALNIVAGGGRALPGSYATAGQWRVQIQTDDHACRLHQGLVRFCLFHARAFCTNLIAMTPYTCWTTEQNRGPHIVMIHKPPMIICSKCRREVKLVGAHKCLKKASTNRREKSNAKLCNSPEAARAHGEKGTDSK